MTVSQSNANGKSSKDKEQAAETQIAHLSLIADDLTQRIDGRHVVMDRLCWREAARLSGVAFEIVAALNRGDIEGAYRITAGDADQDGEVLGMTL